MLFSDASTSRFGLGHCVAKGIPMKARRWIKGTSTVLHKNVGTGTTIKDTWTKPRVGGIRGGS